ncbi:putative toxin-antitoxin system toxin component, PIN family [Candidatus Shapirobacteria bacterium]|nr:putative toxin-antitoxin system toxin component, PIN family [Candidatus Shapirobacteria bacterium]
MSAVRVFVDSDVVISSLISQKGVAHLLLFTKISQSVKFYLSNFSLKEQRVVIERLKINHKNHASLVKKRLTLIELKSSLRAIKKNYQSYVNDLDDAHIVSGAKKAKAGFLITYNQKDFKKEEVKKDFGIIILSPGLFLQYLRSIN